MSSVDTFIESAILDAEQTRRRHRHEMRLPDEVHTITLAGGSNEQHVRFACANCQAQALIAVVLAVRQPFECLQCGDLTRFEFA